VEELLNYAYVGRTGRGNQKVRSQPNNFLGNGGEGQASAMLVRTPLKEGEKGHMKRKHWLKLGRCEEVGVKRTLENRIVFCANCDANRTLSVSSSGILTCSSCSSENWMYLSAPLIANFRAYDERKVQERIAVDRYIDNLEREAFFTPNNAFV
jgi:hypothetical protein